MASASPAPIFSYKDLDFLPKEREGDRHELFDGVLVVTPSPIPAHQIVEDNATFELNSVVRPNGLGRVFSAPIDVVFGPKLVAVPDVVFVRRDRLHIVGPTSIEGAPDLIVEILSPSTRRRDLREKRALYERFGVREYWLLDPKARSATVLVLRDARYEPLLLAAGRIRSVVVPGLDVEVAALFAGL
jgi:Uma2 family endonuclease